MAATLKCDTIQNASSSTANLTLDASGNATVGNTLAMGSSFKRNRIINGNMQVWQRGTSFSISSTGTPATYCADRFYAVTAGPNITVSQNSSVPSTVGSSFNYSAKVQRNSGQTSTSIVVFGQTIESLNCNDLSGQQMTLSFWAKAGANFSATSSQLSFYVISGTAADQGTSTWYNSGFTGQATVIANTSTITTTWTKYTATGTFGSGIQEALIYWAFNGSGTAGADDSIYITGVQLEVGSVATPYERQIYTDQLAQCQRYYFKTFADGTAPAQNAGTTGSYILPQMVGASTTQNGVTMAMPVAMRAMATVTLYNPSAANAQIRNTSVNADCSSSAVTAIGGGGYFWGVSPNCVTAAGSAAGNQMRIHFTVDGEL